MQVIKELQERFNLLHCLTLLKHKKGSFSGAALFREGISSYGV